MSNLLYILAVILVIGWAVGFIGFHADWSYSYLISNCSNCSNTKSDTRKINSLKSLFTIKINNMNNGKILLGVLAGVMTGATLGILFAPDSGANTRKKL